MLDVPRPRGRSAPSASGVVSPRGKPPAEGPSPIEVSAIEKPERVRWLAGCWDLAECTFTATDGAVRTPWGASPKGVLVVTPSGDWSAHGGRGRRAPLAGAQATPAEKQQAYDDYFSYFARIVRVDDDAGTIVMAVDGATDPSWIGTEQLRYLDVQDDDSIVLRTPLVLLGGNEVIGRMAWRRRRGGAT
jgi:hypothetical protein